MSRFGPMHKVAARQPAEAGADSEGGNQLDEEQLGVGSPNLRIEVSTTSLKDWNSP